MPKRQSRLKGGGGKRRKMDEQAKLRSTVKSKTNDVEGEPVQVLQRLKTGGPFAHHAYFTMKADAQFVKHSPTANSVSMNVVTNAPQAITPFKLLDPLGGASEKVQAFYTDQLFAIWQKGAVLSARFRWKFELEQLGAATLQSRGFWMVAVVTPGPNEDGQFNQTQFNAIPHINTATTSPRRIKEYLAQHSHTAKVYKKFIPAMDESKMGKFRRPTLEFDIDPCKQDGADITPGQIVRDEHSAGSFYSTVSVNPTSTILPHVHCYLIAGHGGTGNLLYGSAGAEADMDGFHSFDVKLNTYWRDPVATGFSTQ